MNDETRKILDNLTTIKTKQEERHRENKDDLKAIFKKLEKLDSLPCDVHSERMKGLETRMQWLYMMVLFVIVIGILLGLWVKGIL